MNRLSRFVRTKLRQFLGIDHLESGMAISAADQLRLNEKINAVTSRVATQLGELTAQLAAYASGAQAANEADVARTQEQVNTLLGQLDQIGRNAADPVPAPSPGQAEVEPGPDVPAVENPQEAEVVPDGSTPGSGTPDTEGGSFFRG